MQRIGWWLCCFGFGVPFLICAAFRPNAVGPVTEGITESMILMVLVIYVCTKRATEWRARVILTAGVLATAWAMCGAFNLFEQQLALHAAQRNLKAAVLGEPKPVVLNTYRNKFIGYEALRSDDLGIVLINQLADTFRSRYQEEQQFSEQFSNMPLSRVLSAQRLSTNDGIIRSKFELAFITMLESNRENFVDGLGENTKAIINRSDVSQSFKDALIRAFYKGYAPTFKRSVALGAVRQLEIKNASSILDLAGRNLGHAQVSNIRVQFSDEASQHQYQQLAISHDQLAVQQYFILATIHDQFVRAQEVLTRMPIPQR